MAPVNYLIGRGELLAQPLDPPARRVDKEHPYSVEEARQRLLPQLTETVSSFAPDAAYAPDGVFVSRFTLHPAYTAKSYNPAPMLRSAGLEIVGSRERVIRVDKHTSVDFDQHEHVSSELFVAGSMTRFQRLLNDLSGTEEVPAELEMIREFELIEPFPASEKLKSFIGDSSPRDAYEIVVHLPSGTQNNRHLLLQMAEELGIQIDVARTFEVGTLWFLPAIGPYPAIAELARFTTVRLARPMPRLVVDPMLRGVPGLQVELPPAAEQEPGFRVALLDGGLPDTHPLDPWIESYWEANPSANAVPAYTDHGLAVASAFLFGPLEAGVTASTPPAKVTVVRVLDSETGSEDPLQLYTTLGHVEEVLLSRAYELINISLGPDLPIEDGDVHAWTSVIDDHLSDGQTLLSVAAGNNGDLDRPSGNARVQVPGDAVNALTVGAADSRGAQWSRAPYSALGPGRTPGRVKPDVLAFGGAHHEPFHVLDASGTGTVPTNGTSFAAPLALRQAARIRALLGADLDPLTLRALLIHSARRGAHHVDEVGWGRIPEALDDFIVSGEGVARIIYQGDLKPGKYLRAKVPRPAGGFQGRVAITATFCFATAVDAGSPDTYTRAALEPVFRPNLQRFDPGAKTPKSRPFFPKPDYSIEAKLRSDFGKWEPVLHASDRMLGSTLQSPHFDIHYNAREVGGKATGSEALHYALVITLEAPRHVNLHQEVLEAYPDLLVPISPAVDVEVSAT